MNVAKSLLLFVILSGCVGMEDRDDAGDGNDEDLPLDERQADIGSPEALSAFTGVDHDNPFRLVTISGAFISDFNAFSGVRFQTDKLIVERVAATSTRGLDSVETSNIDFAFDGLVEIAGLDAVREVEMTAFPSVETIDLPGLVTLINAVNFIPHGNLCVVNIPSAAPAPFCEQIVSGEPFTCGPAADLRPATVATGCPAN